MRSSNLICDCICATRKVCAYIQYYIPCMYIKGWHYKRFRASAFSPNQMIRRQTVECTTPSSTHCVKDLLVFLLLRCWTFCLCHFCLKKVLDEMVGTETLSCFCVLYHHISKTIYMS